MTAATLQSPLTGNPRLYVYKKGITSEEGKSNITKSSVSLDPILDKAAAHLFASLKQ